MDGFSMRRAKILGRAWYPISSASRNPSLTINSAGSPLRSSSALVATVVPILTLEMRCDGSVFIGSGILREQLSREKRAVRRSRNDVGEGAAPVDEELPLAACAHPM